MAYGILTEDFLAIGLVLAEGDVNLTTGALLGKVEQYQQEQGSWFGVTDNDFRSALIMLAYFVTPFSASATPMFRYSESAWDQLENAPIHAWFERALDQSEVYFNDEGEHWMPQNPSGPSEPNTLLRNFLRDNPNSSPDEVLRFLSDHGWTYASLAAHLEAGERW